MHATKSEKNLSPIAREGLKAGARRGIGDPDTGQPFNDRIFVARRPAMRFVTSEAGGGNVAVVSTREPNPDLNYKGGDLKLGDAGYFSQPVIEPLRNARSNPHGGPYSFVFPMTLRTKKGAKAMLRHLNPGRTFTSDTAADVLTSAFRREFDLYVDLTELQSSSSSPTRGRSISRAFPTSRSPSSDGERGRGQSPTSSRRSSSGENSPTSPRNTNWDDQTIFQMDDLSI